MEKRYEIEFEYADQMSNWETRKQSCSLYAKNEYEARQKCIKLYGLGVDCEYEIMSVKAIEQ